MGSGLTDLASHVYKKVNTSSGIRQGSRHERIRGLWLLLGIAADGVGVEKDIEDERFWFCFPCVVNNTVSGLDRTIYNSDTGTRIHVLRSRHNWAIVKVRTEARKAQSSEGEDTRWVGREATRLTRLSRAALQTGVHFLGIYATTARARETRTLTQRDLKGQRVREWTSEVAWHWPEGAPPLRSRRRLDLRSLGPVQRVLRSHLPHHHVWHQPTQHQTPRPFTTPPETRSQQQFSQSRTRRQLDRRGPRPGRLRQHQC